MKTVMGFGGAAHTEIMRCLAMEVEIKAKAHEKALSHIRNNMGSPEILHQKDIYYDHPCKSYAETDESVRIRHENGRIFMTYKGPKIDTTTKTREEIEFSVPEDAERFLERTGFVKKIELVKERRLYHHDGFDICVDYVNGLGVFIEIERQGDPDTERPKILELAAKMGLKDLITLSYMEMLTNMADQKHFKNKRHPGP